VLLLHLKPSNECESSNCKSKKRYFKLTFGTSQNRLFSTSLRIHDAKSLKKERHTNLKLNRTTLTYLTLKLRSSDHNERFFSTIISLKKSKLRGINKNSTGPIKIKSSCFYIFLITCGMRKNDTNTLVPFSSLFGNNFSLVNYLKYNILCCWK